MLLNDRTINLLMKGKLDMRAGISEVGGGGNSDTGDSVSDAETLVLVHQEEEVEIFKVEK